MGLNYVTLEMAKELIARETCLASNLRLVMWPVENAPGEMTQKWWDANRNDFVLMVDNIRKEEYSVVADFDFGIYGTHKVRLVVGSYVTTVPYLGTTYAETKEYGKFFSSRD